jgi:dolichyl-phosphate-mannose-protein mannosyltransferase
MTFVNRLRSSAARVRLSPDVGLLVVTGLMILFGVGLRAQGLGFPPHFTFDEHHFVENARPYLSSGIDRNDHPPLGKLLIALSMRWVGDTPTGWRLFPLCFGLVNIALAGALAGRLFRDWRAAAIAAAFVAVDGFFISYSRTALLDGMLTSMFLASALAIVTARRWPDVLLASALVGLAVSIKFSGITLVAALVMMTLVLGRAPRLAVLGVGSAVVVYYAQYALGLALTGRDFAPRAVWEATLSLTKHHLALTDMTNPATSHWYTWFTPRRPLLLAQVPVEGGARVMTSLGNPLLWWGVNFVVLSGIFALLESALRRLRKLPQRIDGFFGEHRFALFALLMFYLLPIVPWIVSRRDSYIWHYLPAYGFGLILVAGAATHLYKRRLGAGLAALILVAEISVFYAPVWGKYPITHRAIAQRLFVSTWR